MEKQHRDAIQGAYPLLVQHTDIDALLPALVQKRVFSPEMISKYQNSADNRVKRKRQLFLDVQMRGPNAFAGLITSLRETGQNYLAGVLDPSAGNTNSSAEPRRHARPFMLSVDDDVQQIREIASTCPSNAHINLNSTPIEINVTAATRLYDDQAQTVVPVYSTHSRNRGAVLIINIINYLNDLQPKRKGADVDGRNLTELFLQMGLQVEMHIDLTGSEMEEAILNFKSSLKIKGVDMVFIIIMGHGQHIGEVTDIFGTDNKSISTDWLEEQFDNTHCKTLQMRPKIFMYQTCRGLLADFGVARRVEIDSAPNHNHVNKSLRTRSDMLIAYSTVPGKASHRDIFQGTWYINIFCQIMMDHAHNMHLEDVFKMVDNQLEYERSASQTMQTSTFTNVGFKSCYVHPKIYMEDGEIRNIHEQSTIPVNLLAE